MDLRLVVLLAAREMLNHGNDQMPRHPVVAVESHPASLLWRFAYRPSAHGFELNDTAAFA